MVLTATEKSIILEEFASLPEAVKKQLHVMCVWFTEECGGILTMEFEPDGTLEFKHTVSEYDGYCDEIGADLKIKQYRQEGQEFLKALSYTLRYFTLARNRKNEAENRKCRTGTTTWFWPQWQE